MPYNDGAKTIFLYTQGTKGDIPSDLQELLGYMADTKVENATTDTLRELQSMVDVAKGDTEVSRKAMSILVCFMKQTNPNLLLPVSSVFFILLEEI